jgi:hypothetical protein
MSAMGGELTSCFHTCLPDLPHLKRMIATGARRRRKAWELTIARCDKPHTQMLHIRDGLLS